MTAVVIGLGYVLVVCLFLAFVIGMCKSAALGDDIARRALGPASSDPFDFAVGAAMYDESTPTGKGH